jgi:hypothetical protein
MIRKAILNYRLSLAILTGVAFLLVGCASDSHQCESETIAKLTQLGELITRKIDATQLSSIENLGDLLQLFRANSLKESDTTPDDIFQKDGWRDPFVLEKRQFDKITFVIIYSKHNDHKYNKPLAITILMTDNRELKIFKSWTY